MFDHRRRRLSLKNLLFILFCSLPGPLLRAENLKSEVDFQWEEVEGATHYVVTIARDPTFQKVITNIDTARNKARSQALPPGAYYWTVDAFDDMQHLHRLEPKPLVVGSPYRISVETRKLPPPHTLSPPSTSLYPPISKVRLAWAQVPGAKQYLFRLWDEDNPIVHKQIKRKSHLRWETTVDQPWIVVHDAPYSSFMYLDTGHYRWEVAALDQESHQIGNFATGHFEMHKKFYFKPHSHILAGHFLFGPRYVSKFTSATAETANRQITTTYGADGAWHWWPDRRFGTKLAGDVTAVIGTRTIRRLSLEGRYRHKITNAPTGWHYELGLGGYFLQLPHVQLTEPIGIEAIDTVSTIGPLADFSLVKKLESPFEARVGFKLGLPLLLVSAAGGGGDIRRGYDMHLYNEWRWFTSEIGFVTAAFELFLTEVRFQPTATQTRQSMARFIGPSLQVGVGLTL